MPAFWIGIDSGKRAHHCVMIDQTGTVLLSKRIENDEIVLLDLITTVAEIAAGGEVCWATDLNAGGAALLIELLAAHAQQLLYIPGRIVHHAAATHRGDGKTDAKDARITADQARMRTDLQPVRGADQISVDLRLLTARRTDLICDRVRAINRLRATLLEYFPALERAFDYSKRAPMILLGGYQTPEGIRRVGLTRLAGWLRKRGCRNSATMAEKALTAANSQHTVLPTQTTGSALVVRLAARAGIPVWAATRMSHWASGFGVMFTAVENISSFAPARGGAERAPWVSAPGCRVAQNENAVMRQTANRLKTIRRFRRRTD